MYVLSKRGGGAGRKFILYKIVSYFLLSDMCNILNTVGGPPTDQLLANWVTTKSC